jgi:hypothetical protein
MPELTAEDLLLLEQAFSEVGSLIALLPSAMPVVLNGLMTGVSKCVNIGSDTNVDMMKLVGAAEQVAEQHNTTILEERKQHFARVYETHKKAIKSQWEMVAEKDMKDLILEYQVSDFDVISHAIRQKIARGEFPEEQLSKTMGMLALVDSLRLGVRTAVSGSLSSLAEYSEALGYYVAEQVSSLSPQSVQGVYDFFASIQQSYFQAIVAKNVETKGIRAFGDIPLDLDKHANNLAHGKTSVVSALVSMPFSVMSYIAAGAYEGLYYTTDKQKIPQAKHSTSQKTREEIELLIKEAQRRKREQRAYEQASMTGKLMVNLQSTLGRMYSTVEGGITQLREDWDKAYAVTSASYDKTDKKVEKGMSLLLSSIPYKSTDASQVELAARQRIRERQRLDSEVELAHLKQQDVLTPEERHKIATLDKVLELDDLRKSTDVDAQRRVAVLEQELQGSNVVDAGSRYDSIRATITASALFTKAETYAASRAIARGTVEVTSSAIQAVTSGISSALGMISPMNVSLENEEDIARIRTQVKKYDIRVSDDEMLNTKKPTLSSPNSSEFGKVVSTVHKRSRGGV